MSNSEYFMGQGPVYVAELDANGLPLGLTWIGDAEMFELQLSQKFDDVFESYTGRRSKAAHILTQTEGKISIKMLNYSVENLARATQGAASGTVASGSVTAEAINAYPTRSTLLANMNVSSVVVKKASTTLVAGTDYTLDAAKGLLTFLSGSTNVTGSPDTPTALTVDYAYAANAGKVEGLTTGPKAYRLVFMGTNIANEAKGQVRADVHRAVLDVAKALSMLDSKHGELDVEGEMLIDVNQPVGTSQYFTITKQY